MKICPRLLIFELSDCMLRIFRGYYFSIFLILLFLDRYFGGFDSDLRASPPVCLVMECPPPGILAQELKRHERSNLTLLCQHALMSSIESLSKLTRRPRGGGHIQISFQLKVNDVKGRLNSLGLGSFWIEICLLTTASRPSRQLA